METGSQGKVSAQPIWLLGLLEGLGLILVMILAVYLRYHQLAVNPGWYSDEGTLLEVARHLAEGRFQYLAVNQSILLFGRPPAFALILAGIFQFVEVEILTLRLFTAGLGVLSVGLLYLLVYLVFHRTQRWLPLLTALIFAIYPSAIIYSRLGFSYNILTPLILLAAIGLWGYLNSQRRAWLLLAVASIGFGTLNDLMMISLLLPFLVIVSAVRWKDLLWSLPLLIAPFVIYILVMLVIAQGAFLFDLRFTLDRLGEVPFIAQLPVALVNFTALLVWDLWFPLAIVGFFSIKYTRWKRFVILLFFLPLFSLMRTTGLIGLGFYYVSPLFPFIAIGVASLIYAGAPVVFHFSERATRDLFARWHFISFFERLHWLQNRTVVLATSGFIFVILITPILFSTILTLQQVTSGFSTGIDWVLIEAGSARKVIDYLNRNTERADLVVLSPALAWDVKAQVADYQMAVAVDGIATQHLPEDLPADRWEFDPRIERAKYVVVDKIWRNWAAGNMEEVAALMAEVENWPLAYQAGEIFVHQNPEWR